MSSAKCGPPTKNGDEQPAVRRWRATSRNHVDVAPARNRGIEGVNQRVTKPIAREEGRRAGRSSTRDGKRCENADRSPRLHDAGDGAPRRDRSYRARDGPKNEEQSRVGSSYLPGARAAERPAFRHCREPREL